MGPPRRPPHQDARARAPPRWHAEGELRRHWRVGHDRSDMSGRGGGALTKEKGRWPPMEEKRREGAGSHIGEEERLQQGYGW